MIMSFLPSFLAQKCGWRFILSATISYEALLGFTKRLTKHGRIAFKLSQMNYPRSSCEKCDRAMRNVPNIGDSAPNTYS